MASRIEGNHAFVGQCSFASVTLPTGSITNTNVSASADIVTTKMEHRKQIVYAQESATSCTDEARVVHVVKGATGTVIGFRAGVVVACVGAAVIDIDLLKNGTTILSAAIQLDSGDAAYAKVDGTISSASLVAGDVLEISIDETTGGGTQGKGLFADLIVDEKAA